VVGAGGVTELPLGNYPLVVPPDILAVRVRWKLHLRSGEVLLGGVGYPAMGFDVRPCALERLAPFLPSDPVAPQELARYAREGVPYTPALLERAVRIPAADRSAALDLLAPIVESSPRQQIELLAPALRWLTDRPDPPSGATGWKTWFRERREAADARRESERRAPAGNLDLGRRTG
jgi:hypothetical protein